MSGDCDGTWQHQTVELGRWAHKKALQRGDAYVQFCLYTMAGEDMYSATVNRWAKVKVG